jgi:hypothetical protein
VARVADYAHDRAGLGTGRTQHELVAQGILAREQVLGHFAIDHRDGRRALHVAGVSRRPRSGGMRDTSKPGSTAKRPRPAPPLIRERVGCDVKSEWSCSPLGAAWSGAAASTGQGARARAPA